MRRLVLPLLLLTGFAVGLSSQTLSDQVLQLLTRDNTWTGAQSFQDIRVPVAAVPADTSARIYTDVSGNLYYNGGLIAGAGGGVTPHNLLSTTHADTVAAAALRGAILIGNSTPAWQRLAIGASGTVLRSDGTDAAWSADGTGLTTLNASSLSTGTVPLARLVGITNTEIAAGAAIAWTKLSKTGSSLADLTTRSAADLSSGTLPDARLSANVTQLGPLIEGSDIATATITFSNWASNGCAANQFAQWSGASWQCATVTPGTGTVTSVALALPAIFSVSGSPVTTSGTLTGALATQVANRVWAGPTTGADAAPTFRVLVNADLPLTGVSAGTYASVTVNTAGVVTAGTATMNLATQATGTLGVANGGTGLTAIGDDNIFLGSAATTAAAAAVPNCVAGALGYATATNLFSCTASVTTAATTDTFTNKTYDTEGTGNVFGAVTKQYLQAAFCQNATAGTDWSTPTADPAVAACVTGSNTQKGVLDFADGAATLSAQTEFQLPADWDSGKSVDVAITWYSSGTAGNVVWQVATICVADGETGDPAFNTASTVTDATKGVANQYNAAAITGLTMTGCAAGEQLYLRVFRDPTSGSDTLAATARLVGIALTYRRAL